VSPEEVDTSADASLERAILDALDGLLSALELEALGDDRFRVLGEPGRFDRVFGGQTVAQALLAASATVTGKDPHSLHAYFVEAGAPEEPLDLVVERVRDGRSISTRTVSVTHGA
jgi:acyl-CoA thioesterase II